MSKSPEGQSVAKFSIATPTVTTILPMTENLNDTSFMQPATYPRDDISNALHLRNDDDLIPQVQKASQNLLLTNSVESHSKDTQPSVSGTNLIESLRSSKDEPEDSTKSDSSSAHRPDDCSKSLKKRNKLAKKGSKLDAKSKLEKSRQSARECRARKKLRYQYLEDLVSNREKAVVKLKKELSTFCELSRQIDNGTIDEASKLLLIDQIKTNNLNA